MRGHLYPENNLYPENSTQNICESKELRPVMMWRLQDMARLAWVFQEIRMHPGQYLTRQGFPAGALFIITSGIFQVRRKIRTLMTNAPVKNGKRLLLQESGNIYHITDDETAEKLTKKSSMLKATVGTGACFGISAVLSSSSLTFSRDQFAREKGTLSACTSVDGAKKAGKCRFPNAWADVQCVKLGSVLALHSEFFPFLLQPCNGSAAMALKALKLARPSDSDIEGERWSRSRLQEYEQH